jgi:hypothetical protein
LVRDGAFVDHPGYWFIAIDVQRFASLYYFGVASRQERVLNLDDSFLHFDERTFVVIVHGYVERGSTDRDDGSWCQNTIRVWEGA